MNPVTHAHRIFIAKWWLLRQNIHPRLRETMVQWMACISEMLGERRIAVMKAAIAQREVYIELRGVAGEHRHPRAHHGAKNSTLGRGGG